MINSPFQARKLLSVLIAAGATSLLLACSPDSSTEAPAATQGQASGAPESVMAAVRGAVGDQNLGDAAVLVKAAQSQFPTDPRIHLLAAEVEARLGNAGNSAAAFRRALDSGLDEPIEALRASAFDPVRGSATFRQLQTELAPGKLSMTPRAERSPTERVQAGDVKIITDATGDYVRAGDIVLDTRP